MTFRFVADPDAMEEHGFGFREPSLREPEARAGRDRRHRRPRARARSAEATASATARATTTEPCRATRRRRSPWRVAFDFQLVAEVPDSAADVRVAWVVTDARSLVAPRSVADDEPLTSQPLAI